MCRLAMSLVSVLVLACLASPVAAQGKGKKFAVLIGVTEYDHANLSALKYTEHDVEELAEILDKKAGFSSVQVMTVSRGKKDSKAMPTKANIEKALEEVMGKAKRHDTVLVALAGHGVQLDVQDPDEKGGPKPYSYFCPTDADFKKISYSTGKAPKLILMPALMKDLAECGAGTKLILVDACRNELKATSSTRDFSSGKIDLVKGMAAMFSCKPGERAWETDKLGKKGHGVFFHYVIEGLKGEAKNKKGEVTWSSLAEYVNSSVSEEVPRLFKDGAAQTPHSAQNFFGASPVLLGKVVEEDDLFRKGMNLLLGRGVKMDVTKAEEALQESAKKGNHVARATLIWAADYLVWGMGTQRLKDLPEATITAVKKAAEAGDADAQVALGKMYMRGLEGGDDKEAYKWMCKAAEKGHWMGINDKAWLEGAGRGTERDAVESKKGFEKAAALGYGQSMVNLGQMHLLGYGGVAKDAEEAAKWYQKAADAGHPYGQVALARLYRTGEGVERDSAKALSWARKAAEQGLGDAQNLVGFMYENDEKDAEEAVIWYRKAADQGEMVAQHNLALMYLGGRGGLTADTTEAFKLMLKSADQGFASAQQHLGWMYENGKGTGRDDDEAVKWYQKAADRGNVPAQFALGRMYEEGRGVGQSDEKALAWYKKAAEKGHKGAAEKVKKLQKESGGGGSFFGD